MHSLFAMLCLVNILCVVFDQTGLLFVLGRLSFI